MAMHLVIEYQKCLSHKFIIEEEDEDEQNPPVRNNDQTGLSEPQRTKMIKDLSNVTIKQWFTSIYHEVF